MSKARWFELPSGSFQHGVGIDNVYVHCLNGKYSWYAGVEHNKSGFLSREDAIQDAERDLCDRLSAAVEAMGGHIVWPSKNMSRPS